MVRTSLSARIGLGPRWRSRRSASHSSIRQYTVTSSVVASMFDPRTRGDGLTTKRTGVTTYRNPHTGLASGDAAPERPRTREGHHLAVHPAGQLLPEHGGAELGPDRRHGLLLRFPAQPGLERRLEVVEHPAHARCCLVRFLRFVHLRKPNRQAEFSTTCSRP